VNPERSDILAEVDSKQIELNQNLLKVYNYYRIFIGFALLLSFAQSGIKTQLGALNPSAFMWLAVLYCLLNVIGTVTAYVGQRKPLNKQHWLLLWIVSDIFMLAAMMYTSGGIGSGIAPLILITVVSGAILITGRQATLIPAAASIAVLGEELYLSMSQTLFNHDFFQAGVFGGLFFAASLSIQRLSHTLRHNDIRALAQAEELAELERLNKVIIQRMQTGIVVVDQHHRIRLCNQSARVLMGMQTGEIANQLPEALSQLLEAWLEDNTHRAGPLRIQPDSPEFRVNFLATRSSDIPTDITLFLEDTGEVQQQVQQLKLAELGRLSASIAHEIRNPLGAISHAAQLLKESTSLQAADERLSNIIINHSNRMNGVVENVLEMSRRRSPQPIRLNLHAHLEKFTAEFKQARPEAQIDLTVNPQDTEIRVDPNQLNQALTNLVENGIRYSKENDAGPKVRLEGGIERTSERPYLNILDYGPGVSAEQEQKLFQPFSTTASEGTGLGLYLSRELCESNQAQLSYTKQDTAGSCFRILFAHPDRITL